MSLCKSANFTGDFISITPNQRLARIRQGMTFSGFIKQCAINLPYCLNNHQVELIFKDIITRTDESYLPLTSLVIKSWRILQEWDFPIDHPSFSYRDESQLFQQWILEYQSLLQKNNWIDEELLWQNPLAALPKKIILYGFGEFTPRENKLIRLLKSKGVEIQIEQASITPEVIHKTSFIDEEAEIEAIASWAYQKASLGHVACVFPQLALNKNKIWATFERVFDNNNNLLNISLGRPLLDYGAIQAVLAEIESHAKPSLQLAPIEWSKIFNRPIKDYLFSKQFKLLLENFASLSDLLGIINFESAFGHLKQLARKTLYQTESSEDTRVEILGALEASGLTFDYAWIAGLHEEAWPLDTPPNPFLPFSLKDKNLQFCQKITEQLLHSGKEIILSYPKSKKDITLYESYLIQPYPEINLNINLIKKPIKNINFEIIEDSQAPEFKHLQHFGSELFKDQSACPFRAFVKHRLGAKKLEDKHWGLSALEKGNLVHKLLEKLLENSNPHEINLSEFINMTIKNTDLFSQVEKKRLEKLMSIFLAHEKNRIPFSVVATEKKIETHINQLPLKLRIDRIDKIAENKYLIIDYKTGKSDIKIDPYKEPQLPLYCVTSDLPIESVAVIQVRTDEIHFCETKAQKAEWAEALNQLAEEFISGHAVIKPRDGEETCRYCELASLCRIKSTLIPNEGRL